MSPARAAGLFAATVLLVVALDYVDPFTALGNWLTGGGATTRMQPVAESAEAHERTHGDDLLKSLPSIRWDQPTRRILVIGNSQQYTASLPRGATIQPGYEVTVASDLLAQRLRERVPGAPGVYTAGVPNQTFVETLWQGIYWLKVAPIPPAALLLQSSFDTYRKTGIRPGFQRLLEDERFVRALDEFTREAGGRSYLGEFADARRAFVERKRELALSASWTPEAVLRRGLARLPLYQRREKLKADFLTDLYLIRVLLFRVSPTTKRHMTGQPLEQSFDALTDLVRLARSRHVPVFIYNAPVNPAVDMFFESEYRAYLARLQALAESEEAQFADLANAVAAGDWGYWIDGPDPIHVGERGHRTIAARLDAAFGHALARR